MKKAFFLSVAALLSSYWFKAQNNTHQYYLEAALNTGLQQESFTGGVGGAFGLFLNNSNSVDVRGREMYSVNYKTFIGSVTVNYRHHFLNGIFVGAGFAHQHEIFQDHFFNKPVDAALGTHKLIDHRSGVNIEGGYFFKAFKSEGILSKIYPVIGLNTSFMTGDKLPNPLITVNFGLRFGFKKL